MGSIIGHKIDYNGVGVSERLAAHTQQKLSEVPPPPPTGPRTIRVEISEIPRAQWNGTFRLHRRDPSHRAFGYRPCKQDTKKRYCQGTFRSDPKWDKELLRTKLSSQYGSWFFASTVDDNYSLKLCIRIPNDCKRNLQTFISSSVLPNLGTRGFFFSLTGRKVS